MQEQLTLAQSLYDGGDTEAALVSLAEAQQMLADLQAACGGTSVSAESSAVSIEVAGDLLLVGAGYFPKWGMGRTLTYTAPTDRWHGVGIIRYGPNWEITQRQTVFEGYALQTALSPDGSRVAIVKDNWAYNDHTVEFYIFNLATGEATQLYHVRENTSVGHVAWLNNHEVLFSVNTGKLFRVDLNAGTQQMAHAVDFWVRGDTILYQEDFTEWRAIRTNGAMVMDLPDDPVYYSLATPDESLFIGTVNRESGSALIIFYDGSLAPIHEIELPFHITSVDLAPDLSAITFTNWADDYVTDWDQRNVYVLPIRVQGVQPWDQAASGPPAGVTDAYIAQVSSIQTQLAAGELDSDEAQTRLDAIAAEIGGDALGWIVRNIPVYDAEQGRWVSFNDYAQDFADEAGVAPGSRLEQDPIGVGIDLFTGNYEVDDILDWMGFAEE